MLAALVLLASTGVYAQLDLLRSHKQTPAQYAAYATEMIGKRVGLDANQKKNVYQLYLHYASWLVSTNPSNDEWDAYKKHRNDTLRSILTDPQYQLHNKGLQTDNTYSKEVGLK